MPGNLLGSCYNADYYSAGSVEGPEIYNPEYHPDDADLPMVPSTDLPLTEMDP